MGTGHATSFALWLGFSFHLSRVSEAIRKYGRFVESFHTLGLPGYFVYVAGIIELFGGLAIAFGCFTPVVGMILLLEMAVAMWKYNFNEGIYAVREYELPLILGLASLALAATGAGTFSLDHLIFRRTQKHVDQRQPSP